MINEDSRYQQLLMLTATILLLKPTRCAVVLVSLNHWLKRAKTLNAKAAS